MSRREGEAVMFDTGRLSVRRFLPEDCGDLADILTDPEVTYFEPYETFTREACVQEAVKLSRSREFYAVVLGGRVIGKIYFSARGHGSYEIGYTFNRAYQGMGYAFESVCGMMGYAFRVLGVRRISADINARNVKSIRLAERLGMRREALHREFLPRKENENIFDDMCVYALLKSEFAD